MKALGWTLVLGLASAALLCVGEAEIVWQEDFESPQAQDDWYSDFGIWEIGVPTYGPPANAAGSRAFEGANCLATLLGADYADDRHSRVVGPRFVVPEAHQSPRLRFWHWWRFNCYDWGQVVISTDHGANWKALSGGFSADSSGRWSRAWFDLTAYAGQTVRLGFYFQSQSGPNCEGWDPEVAPGWYVDDLVVETGPLPEAALPGQPEGFEAGWGGWHVSYIASLATDFGIWEIGSPTSGPGGAHTGTNCAATVLGGNYLDDRTARLESPAFVVPVASELPRLRFWHWWRFNCYDFGRVEISRDNGVNWGALSGEFSADSSGRWSRGWFDLTAYAGQTVRLGFYFQSQSGPNCEGWDPEVAPGWYVDDLLVETGPLPLRTLPESFEEGSAGWWMRYIGGTATDYGIWEVGVPTSGPGAAHGGTNCAATVLSGNYPDDRSARLISGPFQVPAADLYPRLRFWHWWRFNCYDWGQVQISSDNGANWAGLSDRFTADSTGRWTHPLFDLANFAGQTVWLGFHFQSESGPNCEGWNPEVAPGWYVDDVVIEVDCLTAVPREIVGPEGRLATFAAKACRPDYVFGLGPGAPEGARIDSQLGIFSWVPADCQGPSTNQITVTVTDPGNPTLQPLDYAVVTVVVTEVNEPPVIGAVAPLLLEANVPFSLNASNFVYDPDRPAQTLTYSLDACSPASAKMDSATGRLDWMPTAAEAAQTNTICLRVTDDAGLSATATILAGPFPPDRPPEISQFRLVGTSLELAVENARANDTLVIEAASELAEGPVPTVWTELGSVRWQSNPVRFENVYSANTPGRFFRLKLAR